METQICYVCKNKYPLTTRFFHKKHKNSSEFHSICKSCKSDYNKRYQKTNNCEIYNRKINKIESDVEQWLKRLLTVIKSHQKSNWKGRPSPRKSKNWTECDLDLEYLLRLYELQNGKCAGTGIIMTNKIKDLRAISIDRINSDIGYIKGNIQLVCQFYQLGKKSFSDSESRSIIQEIEMNLLKELKARGNQLI